MGFSARTKYDPKVRCPDIAKAKKLLKWQPQISLKEGLKYCLTYKWTALHKICSGLLITQIFKPITPIISSRFNLCNLILNRCNQGRNDFCEALYKWN